MSLHYTIQQKITILQEGKKWKAIYKGNYYNYYSIQKYNCGNY